MVPTISPNVLMTNNSHRNFSTFGLLGGRFNNSIRLWIMLIESPLAILQKKTGVIFQQ